MSSYLYRGSMQNLDWETRVTDCEIRLLLGLPMADDSQDFLGMFAEEISDRDEQITDLDQKIEDQDKENIDLKEEIAELRKQLKLKEYELKNAMEKKNG